MKLYYFKDPQGNFGDDLNPWLWDRLLPNFFDEDESSLLVGIGTLLNHRVPSSPVKHVLGSGVGYGDLPLLDERWIFHAIRGFESARVLGLPKELVITDAAVLLRAVEYPLAELRDKRFGFIPHCLSSRYFDWSIVCERSGLHYISAEWDVETVLREMSRCEVVLCEAMHGAIVADALRVPWVPVACYDFISEFKWRDWLSTVNLPYEPATVTSLYDVERDFSTTSRAKNVVKRALKHARIWSQNWTPAPRARTGKRELESAVGDLLLATTRQPFLSADSILETHVHRYLGVLEDIKQLKA